ncbi:GTF3C2 [Branchiostoma lanceolatum]|uniref:GTF3C2 protein n=1 Tax=Branchiostoma lanceolatum TaxID=7740 RepID=A0A8J9Z6Y9_BRALA|nr:GTF3C2 [Branchiostoma lanceolatum]
MADKSTPGSGDATKQDMTSSGDATKQDMISSVDYGDMTQSPVVSSHQGHNRGQPRGRGQPVIARGWPLSRAETPEQSFSKVSPKISRGSGQRGRVKILVGSMRSRAGRLRTPTKYSSESDGDKGKSEMESLSTPDTKQQKSRAGEKDEQSNLDGEQEGKIEETDDVVGTTPVRKRRGRPPGKKNQKSLEKKEREKKRSRLSSDESDSEKPHEAEIRHKDGGVEKMTKGEGEISVKRPRLRALGVTPRTIRQCRRKVQKASTVDEDSGKEEEEEEDSQNGQDEKNIIMNTWRQEVEEKGHCVCSKCSCHRKIVKSMWKHYSNCQGKTVHSCTQCESKFSTKGGLRYHLMTAHATSPAQDEPVDERARLRFILKRLGKLQCKNEGCSSSYTTLHGYEYHIQRCGKSANEREVFQCDQCEKTYQSIVGLRMHKKTIHAPSPEPQAAVEETDSPDAGKDGETPGRSKRRAATKALQHLQDFLIDGIEKETKQPSWEQRERSLKHLYSTPELDITREKTQKWTKDVKDVGSVECPYGDCSKTYSSLIGLKGHLPQCDKRPEGIGGTFKCLQCTREFRTQSGVEYHIRKTHKDVVEALNNSGSEDEYTVPNHEDDSSSEDSLSDEAEEDEDDSRSHSTGRRKLKLKRHVHYRPLCQAQDWTHEWKELNLSKEVFPDLRPHKDQFSQLTGDVIQQYTPTTTHSLPITIRRGKNRKEPQAETIGLFESLPVQKDERSFTFFVGGPVWGAEWCPTGQPHTAQYAAISCHRRMDTRHEIDKVSTEPGMIQLWCLGDLKNCSAMDVPYLSLGLAHKFGAVWDMKWCPSGAWDPPQWNPPAVQTPPAMQNPPAGLPRLGLLAVASSDGRVRVISIPHPEALQPIREEQSVSHHALHHLYLVDPALQLVINTSGLHGNHPASEHGQCFTVAWQPDEGHRRLAAGFYDGTVGLWDLQSQSPLLRVCPPSTAPVPPSVGPSAVLNNYLMFCAHDWVVTSVVWSETDSRFIATGSLDRHVKFWDLQAPFSPIQQTRWTAVRTLAWPLHFPGVFAAVDCSCYARSNMRSVHFFFTSGHDVKNCTLPITHHSGTTWSASYNPWRNCVVSADSAGEVVGTVCPVLDPHTDRSFFRFPVYTVDLRPCKSHNPMETSDPNCVPHSSTTSKQHTVTIDREKKAASIIEPTRNQGSSVPTNQNSALSHDLGGIDHGAQNTSLNCEEGQNGCMSVTSQKSKKGAGSDVQESSRDVLPQEKSHTGALLLQPQDDSTSFSQEKQNSTNMESLVHQDQAGSQKQGQQKSETLVGDHPWVEEDDWAVPLSGCSDQEYHRTGSESDGPTQPVKGKPSHTNAANMQSHGPLGLSQNLPGNIPVLSNGTTISDDSQGSLQQKSDCETQDNSIPAGDLGAEVKKQTKEPLETGLQNYTDLVGKYELVFKDTDLTCLEENSTNPEFLRLRKLDSMKDSRPDRTAVEAVHKVAWNPNPGCHIWLLSAGHAGIARVHCIQGLQKTSTKR